jgi:hypothetical protein
LSAGCHLRQLSASEKVQFTQLHRRDSKKFSGYREFS